MSARACLPAPGQLAAAFMMKCMLWGCWRAADVGKSVALIGAREEQRWLSIRTDWMSMTCRAAGRLQALKGVQQSGAGAACLSYRFESRSVSAALLRRPAV